MDSLLAKIQKAKSVLRPTTTTVLTVDGQEKTEKRRPDGTVEVTKVAVRPWGFVGDYKPDLQMAEVAPGLFLGSQDPACELKLLRSHKITHILNLASFVENSFPDKFIYLQINILDLPSEDLRKYLPKCVDFIESALSNDGCVFVHCNAGISRSSSVVIAYLMKTKQLTFSQAFSQVQLARNRIRPNEGFTRQLKAYEKDLRVDRAVAGKL